MQCKMNILSRLSYKCRVDPEHQIHKEHKEASKEYEHTLECTKQNHWRDWLEQATEPDIWTVNKVITASASDKVKARVPALTYKQGNEEKTATTNKEKAQILTKSFFPPNWQIQESWKTSCTQMPAAGLTK